MWLFFTSLILCHRSLEYKITPSSRRHLFQLQTTRSRNTLLESSNSKYELFGANVLALFVLTLSNNHLNIQNAHAAEVVIQFDDVSRLKRGLREVTYLLDHWEEKTLYCNFGEFQRELLTVKNKDKLIVAAAETGLLDYDKSATMNVVCRRDPEVVRAFLGFSPNNNPTLTRAEILMKKPAVVERIDPDDLESYFDAVERYTEAISSVDSLSYQARSDYRSMETSTREEATAERITRKQSKDGNNINNNDNKETTKPNGKKDYLAQTKDSVEVARDALQLVVDKLKL